MPQPPFTEDDPDAAYADDPLRPDVQKHQADHKIIHAMLNRFDYGELLAAGTDGWVITFDSSDGLYHPEVLPASIPGSDGESAYEIAVDNGFVGTEVEWLEFLIGIHWQGEWSNAATYEERDAVRYGRNAFIALQTNTNSTPPDVDENGDPVVPSSNWDVLVAGGIDGTAGEDGAQGIQGPPGQQGDPGPTAEVAEEMTGVDGALTLDLAEASGWRLVLTDATTITFEDTSGRAFSAATLRVVQGAGAPNLVTWDNIPDEHWKGGSAPTLQTGTDEFDEIVVEQMFGEWLGFYVAGFTPPAETFPTLTLVEFVSDEDNSNKVGDAVTGLASYVMGTSALQVGNKRGASVAVVTTTDDGADPPIPTLTGAGASAWQSGGSTPFGTGATRRRLTLFHARDTASGSASFLTVTLSGAGRSHTGCLVKGVRSGGNVPTDWLTQAVAKTIVAQGSGTTASVTLASPLDGANRPVLWVSDNAASAYTPEANHDLVGSELAMTSPTIRVRQQWRDDAFDTSPSGTFGAAVTWAAAGTEYVQG